MLMGLAGVMAELRIRGVPDMMLGLEVGEGNRSFALVVGERGVGKPGYLLPTSVKSERYGFTAVGCGKTVLTDPILKTAPLPVGCDELMKLFAVPSSANPHDGRPSYSVASVCGEELQVKKLVGLLGLLPLLESKELPRPVIRRRA